MRLRFALFGAALLFAACDPGSDPPADAGGDVPVILSADAPSPALQGSVLVVRGLGLEALGVDARLELLRTGSPLSTLDAVPGGPADDGSLRFVLSADAVDRLGPGMHSVDLVVTDGVASSEPYAFDLRIVESLPVDLFEVPEGEVHRNEVAVVNGNGIITATEGELSAHFVGTFTEDAGGASPVDVRLPVEPLEVGDRERGVVVLTTDLGGLQPGTFDGTVQLDSELVGGETSESLALDTTLHFNPPELYDLDPSEASVGQVITVRGAGFLGGPDRPDETTVLRLQGTFTPAGDEPPEDFGPREVVPRWVSGAAVELIVEPTIERDQLASELFGHARGTFMGMATPITIRGVEELEGTPVPFGFVLGPVKQIVYVRFLPTFTASLTHFGLAQAAAEVEQRVIERMQTIYEGWNVELRTEEPEDFTAYARVEIGGPDPNGVGLFGYDNTPGKDIGNLRLADSIGGENAETQMDGYPGYGGVFIESFLYWSEHPDLPGERPRGAPEPDPLFDEVFDEVRRRPATLAEARGDGDPERVAAVADAVHALGSIIGETTSHELGHSLGLAQPYGSPTVYHNDFDGEGCLMDPGGARPLGERMALPGFSTSSFCYDHPDYMDEILSQ